MGWFSDSSNEANAHKQVLGGHHTASWTHELIASAASYEAAKAYEGHVAKNGQPPSHQAAKEILAGFAGAFVDHQVETRGLNFIDKEKVKHEANKQLHAVSIVDFEN